MGKIDDNTSKTAVLNLEFSNSGDFFVVAYDNQKVNREEDGSNKPKEGSYFAIYVHKDSPKAEKLGSASSNSIFKKYDENMAKTVVSKFENQLNVFGIAIYFMCFSKNDNYIMLHSQIIDNYQIRHNDSTGDPVLWNIERSSGVSLFDAHKDVSFKKMQFPNHIYAKYQFLEGNLKDFTNRDRDEERALRMTQSSNNLTLSAIATWDNWLFLGGTMGDIHLAKQLCLSFEKNETAENVEKNRMCQARSYLGHVSYVNQIEYDANNRFLFTAGINDQCVFQWKVTESEKHWDLDFLEYDTTKEDMFLAEVEPKQKYKSIIDELLTHRDEIVHMREKIDETVEPEFYLELHKVVGRKAYNRRNNLLFTKDNNLAFISGSMVVLMKLPDVYQVGPLDEGLWEQNFQQSFLEPDCKNIFSINPEISAITICPAEKYLCAGTTQNNAKLLIWEVTSRTFVKSLSLNNVCTILMLKYADDCKTIACAGLTKNYTTCLYLIDSEKGKILGSLNHLYSVPFKIKDLVFRLNSSTDFVTCGIQHMCQWSLKGDLLTPKEFALKEPLVSAKVDESHDSDNDQHNHNAENVLRCSFLAINAVRDFIITGAEDGAVGQS